MIERTARLIAEIRECAQVGMTRNEAAEKVGIQYQTIVRHSRAHGIEWVRKPRSTPPGRASARNRRICDRYLAGEKQIDLAVEFGITRERVRQIIEKAGLVSEKKRHEDFVSVVVGTIVRKNLTLADAAVLFKISRLNVYTYCRKNGVTPARMTDQDVAELDALADEVINGKSIRQAAGLNNSKAEKVRRHLIKNGIQARGRSRHDDFSERRRLLTEWRGEGLTWKECAERLAKHDGRAITPTGVAVWANKHLPELKNPLLRSAGNVHADHSVTLQ